MLKVTRTNKLLSTNFKSLKLYEKRFLYIILRPCFPSKKYGKEPF